MSLIIYYEMDKEYLNLTNQHKYQYLYNPLEWELFNMNIYHML
jgi:hypothetical protein